MSLWLQGEYEAVLFEVDDEMVGYALFKRNRDELYVRQFFVCREKRRQGLGRLAIEWLFKNAWPDVKRVRLDVLVGNTAGIQFWRSVGFVDYCVTMEREKP